MQHDLVFAMIVQEEIMSRMITIRLVVEVLRHLKNVVSLYRLYRMGERTGEVGRRDMGERTKEYIRSVRKLDVKNSCSNATSC